MKFKVRFADQLVGFFIILSLVSLALVTVALGRSQRWFAKDVSFSTVLATAGGVTRNMPLQYRGFTIGNVRSFYLTDNDTVEVVFSVFEEYRNRVKNGSMVQMLVSPVGLGNQFLFHSGRGEELAEGSFIPVVGSPEALALVRQGLAIEPQFDDSISLLVNRASSILEDVGKTVAMVNEAFGEGSSTELGKTVGSLQRAMAEAETITSELSPVLAHLNTITSQLSDPSGLLLSTLSADGEVQKNLSQSLESITATLENLQRASAFVPAQLPQLASLIIDLRTTIQTAEGVLIALSNNPLLKRGVPERTEVESTGTSPRNIRF